MSGSFSDVEIETLEGRKTEIIDERCFAPREAGP